MLEIYFKRFACGVNKCDVLFKNEERYRLLQVACENHVNRNRECMIGKGVDRHLFVLYVLSKAISIESPFLNYYIAQPWLLSTSQVKFITRRFS